MLIDKLKSNDFKCLRENGKTFKTQNFLFVYSFNESKSSANDKPLKAGFTITKKVGKAHMRNRLRRLLRETLRSLSKTSEFKFKDESQEIHLNIVVLKRSPEKITFADTHDQINCFFKKKICSS